MRNRRGAILHRHSAGAILWGRIEGWDVSILASDLNSDFLARAKEARYGEWALRATPTRNPRAVLRSPRRDYGIAARIPAARDFQPDQSGAAGDEFHSGGYFDLIVCRNVMIYFAADLIRHTVAGFWESLRSGGWLIVGHAEFNPSVFGRFERVSVGDASVYRSRCTGAPAFVTAVALPEAWAIAPDLLEPAPAPRKKSPQTFRPAEAAPTTATPAAPGGILQDVRDLADRGSWQAAAASGKAT